jgi:hypothetical protein
MRFVPAVIASLLLAAHFLRSGNQLLVLTSLGVSFLPLIPRPWARLAHRLLLLAGACEWIRTSYQLAGVRIQLGEPWTRMVMILGAVALFTAASAMLLPKMTRQSRANA